MLKPVLKSKNNRLYNEKARLRRLYFTLTVIFLCSVVLTSGFISKYMFELDIVIIGLCFCWLIISMFLLAYCFFEMII